MFSHMFLLFQLLLLVFLRNCYLVMSQRQIIVHAPPCFWNRTRGFLKAQRSWEPGSSITTIEFSLFRLLRKASAVNLYWTQHDSYLSFSQKILELTLSCVSQVTQYSPGMESPKDIQTCEQVDCHLSSDSFLALCSKAIMRAFLATNASQQDFQRTHAIWHLSHVS